ncbi:MAG: hypothetical protein ACI9GM_000191 [Salibacteraceae bacterium]|jgi:hypothetical protein
MKFYTVVLLIATSITLIQCAQPRNLSGGQKDTSSPKVLHLSPKNLSTNFTGTSIAMDFDEYVKIMSLASELVVSPPLSYPVEYRMKGKRVFFDIRDTLKANTTYNFNFGTAIVDLNEGNSLDSNLFVISTGDFIDSGLIYGSVKDAYTQKPVENATVILYHHTADSALYNGNPLYVTKTDNEGAYQLRFLNNTEYQIFVLATPGENFKYVPLTKVGFRKETLKPDGTIPINFSVFEELDTAQYISKEFSKEHFSFVVSTNIDLKEPSFKFWPINDTMNYIIEEIRSDSFKIWIPGDKKIDTVEVYITDESGFSDTAKISMSERKMFYKKLKRKKETASPVKVNIGTKNGVHHYFDTLRLSFSRPLDHWKVDSMLFVQGTDTMAMKKAIQTGIIEVKIPETKRGTSRQLRSIAVTHEWEPSTDYAFIFNSGSFIDIINQTNDTTILKFKTKNFEDYGSFRFTVKVPNYDQPLLLQLLNSKGEFLRDYKIKSGDEVYHELAIPGTYKFRLILDRNGNNKWDTGDLSKGIQPEEMVYYSGTVDIRANWDMEETWKVDIK